VAILAKLWSGESQTRKPRERSGRVLERRKPNQKARVARSIKLQYPESLRPHCRIAPSIYIQPGLSSGNVYPLVIAAHPSEPYQFAVGLTDGGIQVIEPLESECKWGIRPLDNGTVNSNPAASNQGSELHSR